jgi:hypothetical protein
MSYDLYCYKPTSDIPILAEAESIVDQISEAEESGAAVESSSATREAIAAALLSHNPRLERFQFDYREIASSLEVSVAEARARFQYAELTPPEGDLAIQLTVHNDHVFISIPYWYRGSRADEVFSQLSEYLRVIQAVAGFFTYDPQTSSVFDPRNSDPPDHREYDKVMRELPNIVAATSKPKKSWWRFW